MPRPPTHGFLDGFALHAGPPSKGEQLFRAIHAAIAGGALAAGARLPPTRTLANDLGVARQTVVQVYERLTAEGLAEGQAGAGTRVAALTLPAPTPPTDASAPAPSRRAEAVAAMARRRDPGPPRPLRPGIPDVAAFPRAVWSRLEARYWRTAAASDLGYGPVAGAPELRQAIAGFLGPFRGVPCRPEQVIVTPGSQAAILTAALTVADAGDAVAVESPGYTSGQQALALAGLRLLPVPVDRQGIDLAALDGSAEPPPRAILCTPAHHYPLGVPLSLERRLDLLRRARESGAAVIEDDYDSEFRYDGPPVPTLAALDEGRGRVLYVGTLSKLLAPGLRLGFLVVPDRLIDAALAVRAAMDRQVNAPLQRVCAEFIAGGHLAAHIRRMRPDYAARRQALTEALTDRLGDRLEVVGARMGLHACALMADAAAEAAALAAARSLGFGPAPLSAFELPGRTPRYWGLAMGYADATPAQLRRWVAALARSLNEVK